MAWTRGQFIATLWFFTTFTFILVCTRVYVRLTTRFRPWREFLVIFAWLCYLAQAVSTTLSWYRADARAVMLNEPPPTDADVIYSYKMIFISLICLNNGLNACKAVLLLTCLDVCKRNVFPKIWWSLIITFGILFFMEFGVALTYTFLQCHPAPLRTYWSATEVCYNANYTQTFWTTNFGTDLIIAIVPLILVSRLKSLGKSKKIGISAMFAVGFLNVLAITTNLITYLIGHYNKGSAVAKAVTGTWAGQGVKQFANILVLPTAIIVVCVPQLRVIGRWTFGRNLATSLYRSVGGTYAYSGQSDTLAQSVASKVAHENMRLDDEESRWIAPKMVPSHTVLPRSNYSVTSSG